MLCSTARVDADLARHCLAKCTCRMSSLHLGDNLATNGRGVNTLRRTFRQMTSILEPDWRQRQLPSAISVQTSLGFRVAP